MPQHACLRTDRWSPSSTLEHQLPIGAPAIAVKQESCSDPQSHAAQVPPSMERVVDSEAFEGCAISGEAVKKTLQRMTRRGRIAAQNNPVAVESLGKVHRES